MADELAERCRRLAQGACDVTLVFDKGNNSDDNLQRVEDGPYHFVGSLVPSQHQDLLAIPRRRMRRLDKARLPAVWSYRMKKVVFGVERTVLCTFNDGLFDAQRKTLRREIKKRLRQFQQLQRRLDAARKRRSGKLPTRAGTQKKVDAMLAARHMKDLFAVKVTGRPESLPRLRFCFREKSWKNLCTTLLGKTILFTDRDEWIDEDIVLAYRAQAHVEAAFRRMKDPHFLTFRPTFHWTDQKLRVHAFCCVTALTIVSLLRRKLDQAGMHLSAAMLMEKLADVREVALLYPGPTQAQRAFTRTTLSELDPLQRRLIDTLGLERHQTP